MSTKYSKFGALLTGIIAGMSNILGYDTKVSSRSNVESTKKDTTTLVEDPTNSKDVDSNLYQNNNLLKNLSSNNSASSYYSDQMQYNHDEAQLQRDYTTWQMQNQHQIEVADLKAAGLNPILSANSGAGYGSSSAASASSMDIAELQAATTLKAAQISANSAYQVAKLYTDTSSQNNTKDLFVNVLGSFLRSIY